MYSLERRTSSRTRTQRKTIYDEAISLDKKKRKRKVTTSSGSSNDRKRSTTTKSATATNGGEEDYFGEEDFTGPEYKLDISNKNEKEKVKETLRLYNAYYLRIAQLEEKRCGRAPKDAPNSKGSKSQQKKGNGGESSAAASGKTVMRADLKTSKMMKLKNTFLHPQNLIGALPGIDVGDHFLTRCEMVVLGLHDHWMNGIGYISKSYKEKVEERYRNCRFPLAVSIVISGKYEDNMDNGDDIHYTGQGGNNTKGDCRQNRPQEMQRGNLALQNNIGQDVPVRVIRGHQSKSSDGKPGRTYTYDGLYKVIGSWPEKGASGFTVYKFHLKRIQGQTPLTTKQVTYCRGHVPKGISELPRLVCEDISEGQEAIPIPVTNFIDLEKPTGFKYSKSMVLAENVKLPVRTSGCTCKGKCTDYDACACGKLNGNDFPYVSSNGGRLVNAKSVVYECGPLCGCGSDSANKSSQRGIKYQLEVFRTPAKGWGVKTQDFIPAGAPVCEYTGVLMRAKDIKKTDDADYMFLIDALQTMYGVGGREKRIGDADTPSYPHTETDEEKSESSDSDEEKLESSDSDEEKLESSDSDEEKPDSDSDDQKKLKIKAPEFCIDACKIGNVARFINHSCNGNLYVQSVLSSHEDVKLARVMLYASKNIPPMKELTYDYGYPLNGVLDADGNIRVIKCHCGAAKCRGRVC